MTPSRRRRYGKPARPARTVRISRRDPAVRANEALRHAEWLGSQLPSVVRGAQSRRLTQIWPSVRRALNATADAYDVAADALEEAGKHMPASNAAGHAQLLRQARFLISKTYDTYTEESVAEGEAEDRGFAYADEPHTFSNAIDEVRTLGSFEPSDIPLRLPRSTLSLYGNMDDTDEDGTSIQHALHIVGSESAVTRLVRFLVADGGLRRAWVR